MHRNFCLYPLAAPGLTPPTARSTLRTVRHQWSRWKRSPCKTHGKRLVACITIQTKQDSPYHCLLLLASPRFGCLHHPCAESKGLSFQEFGLAGFIPPASQPPSLIFFHAMGFTTRPLCHDMTTRTPQIRFMCTRCDRAARLGIQLPILSAQFALERATFLHRPYTCSVSQICRTVRLRPIVPLTDCSGSMGLRTAWLGSPE